MNILEVREDATNGQSGDGAAPETAVTSEQTSANETVIALDDRTGGDRELIDAVQDDVLLGLDNPGSNQGIAIQLDDQTEGDDLAVATKFATDVRSLASEDLGPPADSKSNEAGATDEARDGTAGETEHVHNAAISPDELALAEEEFNRMSSEDASALEAEGEADTPSDARTVELSDGPEAESLDEPTTEFSDESTAELDDAERDLTARGAGSRDIAIEGTTDQQATNDDEIKHTVVAAEVNGLLGKNRKKRSGQIAFNIIVTGILVFQMIKSYLPSGLFQKKSPNDAVKDETDKTAANAITALSESEKNAREIKTQDARIAELEKKIYAEPEQTLAPTYDYDSNTVVIPEASLDGLTQIENSDRAVANALGNGSEYLVRDNGDVAIIYQGDVNYARAKLGLDRSAENDDYRFDYSVIDKWPSDDKTNIDRPLRTNPDATENNKNGLEDDPEDEKKAEAESDASIKAEEAPRDFSNDYFLNKILEKRAKAEKEVSNSDDMPEDTAQIAVNEEPAAEDTTELAANDTPEDTAQIAEPEEIADATEPAAEDTIEIAAAEEPAAEDAAEIATVEEPAAEDTTELAANDTTEKLENATQLANDPAPAELEQAVNKFAPYGFNADGSVPFRYEPVAPVSYNNTPEGALAAMALLTSMHIR